MAYEDDFAVDPSGLSYGYDNGASGLAATPTSYAIPENYGNPKNKIYQLSAGADDAIRLKGVDGTVFFEGKGPEAAAKAAEIVQQLGKEFGTQATWILDKQTAGGDWKQVSQDTVGQKKTTALNAFLNVAAPIAGAFIPGLGPVLGAAVGSATNSALQNKNSAQAMKDAAIAAGSAWIGGKLVPIAGNAISKVAPNLSNAVSGAVGKFIPGTAAQGFAKEGVGELIGGISRYGTSAAAGLGSAAGAGAGALLGTRIGDAVKANLDAADAAKNNEIVVKGTKLSAPINVAPLADVATMSLLDQQLADLFQTKDPSMLDKAKKWAMDHPLQAVSLGLTALSGLAGTKGGTGSGSTGNMPGNIGAAGTAASLPSTFTTGTLPPPDSMFTVNARTPAKMNMTTDEWLKYGMGPEKSFFTATPPTTPTTTPATTTTTTTPATTTGATTGTSTGGGTTSATGGTRAATSVNPNPITFLTANTPQAPQGKTPEQLAEERARAQAALAVQIQNEKNKLAGGVAVPGMARGGSTGGNGRKARSEFAVHGAGTGRSDDIPAVLSDGEYVMDAETVALLGDGSNKAGAEKLDQLRVNLRRHKGANLAKGRFSVNAKSPEKYLAGGRVK